MAKLVFDYSKLKGRIKEKCDTQKVFAERLGVTESTLTSKLNCDTYFTMTEIYRATEILDIGHELLFEYFFTQRV